MANVSYRIEDGKIIQVHERRQFSMPLEDFKKALDKGKFFETPALPSNCRLFARGTRGEQYYVVELKPNTYELTHTLFYDEDEDRYNPDISTVSMPWQYMVGSFSPSPNPREGVNWVFHGLFLYWSIERVTSLDSRVFIGMVPNIYHENGKICLGDTSPDSTLEPNERMEILTSNFYTPASVFNAELSLNLPYLDIKLWEKASAEDMLWWRNYAFPRSQTIRHWMGIAPAADNSDPLMQAISTGEAHW